MFAKGVVPVPETVIFEPICSQFLVVEFVPQSCNTGTIFEYVIYM